MALRQRLFFQFCLIVGYSFFSLDPFIIMSHNSLHNYHQTVFSKLLHVLLFLHLCLISCIYVDRQVVASNSIQILDMGKTLRLLKAATADAGSYSCKAINIAGSTEKDFFLDILGE